tara:strand:+ start:227467 stop:228291 length:825 start_codon:yes stop_codon:yes gene_type:complete
MSVQSKLRKVEAQARRELIAELESSIKSAKKFPSPSKDTVLRKDKKKVETEQNIGPKTKKTQKKSLDEVDAKNKSLTSDTPELASTPKPKVKNPTVDDSKDKTMEMDLAEAKRKKKPKKIKKKALDMSQEEAEDLDRDEVRDEDMQDITNKGSKRQLAPVSELQQKLKGLVPELTKSLSQANDMLESAVLGGDLKAMDRALRFVLTILKKVTRQDLVPLFGTVSKLMQSLGNKHASSRKTAAVKRAHATVESLQTEIGRGKVLVKMAIDQYAKV